MSRIMFLILLLSQSIDCQVHEEDETELADSYQTILEDYEGCPQIADRLDRTCKSSLYSCKGRCGKLDFHKCSCQPFCYIRGHCCWDYEMHCPKIAEEIKILTKKMSPLMISTCDKNQRIIESESSLVDNSADMNLNPVVFHRLSGLSFRNEEVYYSYLNIFAKTITAITGYQKVYLPALLNDIHFVFWKKILYNYRQRALNVTEFQQIFVDQDQMDFVEVVDVPPPNAEQCYHNISLECFKYEVRGGCKNRPKIIVDNMILFCRYIAGYRMNTPRQNRVTQKQSNLNHDTSVCEVVYFHELGSKAANTPTQELAISIKPGSIRVTHSETPSLFESWKRVEMVANVTASSVKVYNDLTVECFRGRIFINSACKRPTHLITVIYKITNSTWNAKGVLKAVHYLLESEFNIWVEKNWNLTAHTQIANEKTEILYSVATLIRYKTRMKKHYFPFSESVSMFVGRRLNHGNNTSIIGMDMCLGISDVEFTNINDVSMSCDRLLESGNIVLKHLKVNDMNGLLTAMVENPDHFDNVDTNERNSTASSTVLYLHVMMIMMMLVAVVLMMIR